MNTDTENLTEADNLAEAENDTDSTGVAGRTDGESRVGSGLWARDTEPSEEVVVRRNGLLSLILAALCALVAAAFLSRGIASGGLVSWAIGLALVAMTWGWVFTFLDSRTPLMVADDHGVRLRLGRTWRGIAWTELEEVEHQPRRGLRDGRLVLFPEDTDSELKLLGPAGRRHATANQLLYQAEFTMPLALTTRVQGVHGDLTTSLAALARGRCPIVQVQSSEQVEVDDVVGQDLDVDAADDHEHDQQDEIVDAADDRPDEFFDQLADDPISDAAPEPEPEPIDQVEAIDDTDVTGEIDVTDETESEDEAAPVLPVSVVSPIASATPWPAREVRAAVRADITRDRDESDEVVAGRFDGEDADATQPFDRDRVVAMDDTGVWRASTVVIDDVADLPVVDPAIGPVLATARRMLHLDVDQLAERTRIRPHVIEAIEIDDFAVCGGDFYARGHLRTLARVLGVDAAPLLKVYDERYADAPIDPKRVFEADLAGVGNGPIRSTRGGPNWSVLVAAVMTLVLAWSVARLITDHPATRDDAPSLSNGSAGLTSSETKASAVPVTLTAAGGGAHLVVRDGTGKVVFTGDLAFGQSRTLQVPPPIRVQSTDGSTRVSVQGKDEGRIGKTGQPAEHVYTAR